MSHTIALLDDLQSILENPQSLHKITDDPYSTFIELHKLSCMKWFQFILFEYSIDNSILPLKQSLISTNDLLIPTQWIDNLIRQRLSIIFEIEKLPKEYNPHNMAHKNETQFFPHSTFNLRL